jgi:hypothetical protein
MCSDFKRAKKNIDYSVKINRLTFEKLKYISTFAAL